MGAMGRHRVRKIVLFSILGVFALSAILHLTIEPADYYKSLYSQAEKAETLIQQAELGNAAGQYSEYTVLCFSEKVEQAKDIATAKTLKYSKVKAYYKSFQEEIRLFQKAANAECLSKEEVLALQKEKKVFEKSVSLTENQTLIWSLDGKAVKTPEPINLEVKSGTLYQKEFENFIKGLGVSGNSLTFLHNGALPCNAMITLDYPTDLKDLQVYQYDGKTQKIGNLIRAEAADGQIFFPISEGGVYFILDAAVDDENSDKNLDEILNNAVNQAEKEKEEEKKQLSDDQNVSKAGMDSGEATSVSGSVGSLPSGQTGNQSSSQKPVPNKKYCTVEIRCDTVVDTSKLTNQAVAQYIPKDGTILAETKVEITEGETAFEVLKRVTREEGIQMEFRSDPLYSGAYIEGINHLYELDGGDGSGWMYKINGWFPNYGCSQYKMKDGDKMVWCYTCNIGKDVGDQYYNTHPDANPEYQ